MTRVAPSPAFFRVSTARRRPARPRAHARASTDDDDDRETTIDFSVDVQKEFERGVKFGLEEIRPRFYPNAVSSADRGLPIADALVATSAQVALAAVTLALGRWRPSWLVAAPALGARGFAYLPSALAHGSKLAAVWTVGGLAGRAYERKAFDGTFEEAIKRTVQGGCFAAGLLILLSQAEARARFAQEGLGEPVLGNSPEGDAILIRAVVELFVDIASEATALVTWRAIRWNTSPTDPMSLLPDASLDDDERR